MRQSYVRRLLDLDKDRSSSELFKPEAIPVSIVLDASGREVDRKVGFIAPDEFAAWLRECLSH
ncbi:MAG: hypothetical protein KF696_14915 [Planctomycetes bacterium]|nr:hypothetical protein [Planctomycetota bacterium]MCW8135858.1 hypothetical protein [Planctomycetota bacterium]